MVFHKEFTEFHYKNKAIPVRIDTHSVDGTTRNGKLLFTYNDVDAKVYYDDYYEDYQIVAEKECELIDELGKEDYLTLKDYQKRLSEIEKSKVVINNKVYNYVHTTSESGLVVYHTMEIKMRDGKVISGKLFLGSLGNNDKKNEMKTFNHLVHNVKMYYKETGVEPDEFALDEQLTLDYMKTKIWINKKINK